MTCVSHPTSNSSLLPLTEPSVHFSLLVSFFSSGKRLISSKMSTYMARSSVAKYLTRTRQPHYHPRAPLWPELLTPNSSTISKQHNRARGSKLFSYLSVGLQSE
jgi:hypothetical protein